MGASTPQYSRSCSRFSELMRAYEAWPTFICTGSIGDIPTRANVTMLTATMRVANRTSSRAQPGNRCAGRPASPAGAGDAAANAAVAPAAAPAAASGSSTRFRSSVSLPSMGYFQLQVSTSLTMDQPWPCGCSFCSATFRPSRTQ